MEICMHFQWKNVKEIQNTCAFNFFGWAAAVSTQYFHLSDSNGKDIGLVIKNNDKQWIPSYLLLL